MLIWKDEVCLNGVSEAILAREIDGLNEEIENFVAYVKRKLDDMERNLDSVDHFLIFMFCCGLFAACMVSVVSGK